MTRMLRAGIFIVITTACLKVPNVVDTPEVYHIAGKDIPPLPSPRIIGVSAYPLRRGGGIGSSIRHNDHIVLL